MKKPTFLKLSFAIEILLTIFIPPQMISNPATITYKYGLPFGYLNIYSKVNTDYKLINILFKGNNGINIDIFAFVINLMLIYSLLYSINFIIQKLFSYIKKT